jgi:hypothetical protein
MCVQQTNPMCISGVKIENQNKEEEDMYLEDCNQEQLV